MFKKETKMCDKIITNLSLVFVLCLFGLSLCQEEVELPTAKSQVICETCNCTEISIDCTNRNIQNPFATADWEGLKDYPPIVVNLSSNPLTKVLQLPALSIQILNLSNCEISSLAEGSFGNLVDLETLDLSNNAIVTSALTRMVLAGPKIDGTGLKTFDRMRYLSLAYNDIHSLPQDAFIFMTSLTTLDLSGNPLVMIDQVTMGAISDLVNLREFYLSSCELETLPTGLFRRQRRLRRLDLSNNRFTTIPDVLGEAANLVVLNLGRNPVETLTSNNPIKSLTQLQELRLCRNSKLSSIESSALGLPNLVSLHICYNPRLSAVHPDFLVYTDDHDVEAWPMLKQFYLNNNNISTIDSNYLHRWDKLTSADFSNNPYQCDCNSQWMVDVLVPLLKGIENAQGDMVCKKPAELRGASFQQLYDTTKTLSCTDSESIIELPIPDMAIILGIMIGIFVTFPLVLIVVLLWRKGYFARCRSSKTVSDNDEEMDAF